MMNGPCFDAEWLCGVLCRSAHRWQHASQWAATGVHHGYRCAVDLDGTWEDVLAPFAPVRTAWLAALEPGGFIVRHRDAAPWRERWQVPVRPAGWTWQERTGPVQPAAGEAFRIWQWEPHVVWNDTPDERVHLIIDRDIHPDDMPMYQTKLVVYPERDQPDPVRTLMMEAA